jgi:hypothetical protein
MRAKRLKARSSRGDRGARRSLSPPIVSPALHRVDRRDMTRAHLRVPTLPPKGATMVPIPELPERDDLNQLTSLKLALQLLERRTELSEHQAELVRLALGATDRLTERLVSGVADRRRSLRSEQAEHFQDDDDDDDRADDRQDAIAAHGTLSPAATDPHGQPPWPLAARDRPL